MIFNIILPTFISLILLTGLIKKVNILKCFVEGVKEGMTVVKQIFPVMLLMITAISVFRHSGILDIIALSISPITNLFGLPKEVIPMIVMRPMSGSGSLAVLEDIIQNYGVDSHIGKVAAVISAATETTFYTISLYIGPLNTKCGKIILCAILADLVSAIVASASVYIIL